MRRLSYREPRFAVNFPVCLSIMNSVQLARSTEISIEGIRIDLAVPLPVDAIGRLSFDFQGVTYGLYALVVRSSPSGTSLRFLYRSESERRAVRELVGRLIAPQLCTRGELAHASRQI